MELQLGLALSTTTGFDLNTSAFEPSHHQLVPCKRKLCLDHDDHQEQSRDVPPTLPLLHWNNQPNDDQDPPRDLTNNNVPSSDPINKNDEDVVVGWPPVKSWRKKVIVNYRAAPPPENDCRRLGPNSKFVKVKMEGVGIARKIDLSLFDSHQALMDTLTSMFQIYCGNSCVDDHKLVYQDMEGDWLLAADVPWRTFVQNVQRLKLARTSERAVAMDCEIGMC